VAGLTPRSGAACLSVRRLLLVVASMWVNTHGVAGSSGNYRKIKKPPTSDARTLSGL
jgi:hypothetical protein